MSNAGISSISVHQAILGYDGGHQLLKSSHELFGQDKLFFVQMSDRSGNVSEMPLGGYLTGYPLPDHGVYVLSKTWPATEMSRSGCVWTHSLLIDFTDLAELRSLDNLTHSFRKPSGKVGFSDYGLSIEVEILKSEPSVVVDELLAETILSGLYGHPDKKIILPEPQNKNFEGTVFLIWSQQWPRLRRSFRFCTHTSRDRSTSDHVFDLQFAPSSSSLLSQYAISSDSHLGLDQRDRNSWIDIALADLLGETKPLQAFLRRAGSDISKGRYRFAGLCQLYFGNLDSDTASRFERSLEYVVRDLPNTEGRLLRKSVLQDATENIDHLSDRAVEILLPYLGETTDSSDDGIAEKIGHRLWSIDPSYLISKTLPRHIRNQLKSVLLKLSSDQIVSDLAGRRDLLERSLKAFPNLLTLSSLWAGPNVDIMFHSLARASTQKLRRASLLAFVDADRMDIIDDCIKSLGTEFVFNTMMRSALLDDGSIESELVSKTLMDASLSDAVIEKTFLKQRGTLPKSVLYQFMKRIPPINDITQVDDDDDVWARRWREATGRLDIDRTIKAQLLLMERALALPSAHAPSLLAVALDPLLRTLSQWSQNFDLWHRFSENLLSPELWEWSSERRIVRTVSALAVARKFSLDEIISLTEDKLRVREIVRFIRSTRRGKAYFNCVVNATADGHKTSTDILGRY